MDFLLLAFLWCAVVSFSIPKMNIDPIAFCYLLPSVARDLITPRYRGLLTLMRHARRPPAIVLIATRYFPIDRFSVQFDRHRRTSMINLFDRYHPERHYMRGPGPKWLKKRDGGIDRIGAAMDHHHGN